MAISIQEQILLKIKQRLQLIDEDDGYETTVNGTVIRPARFWTESPLDYQIIVVSSSLTENALLSCPGNPPAVAWDMPVTVTGLVRPSEDDTTPIDTLQNEFQTDIIKALTDAVSWHNWDTLGIDTKITSVEKFVTDEVSGVRVNLTVTFRVSEDNPFESRS
jgi:hypothetical protein